MDLGTSLRPLRHNRGEGEKARFRYLFGALIQALPGEEGDVIGDVIVDDFRSSIHPPLAVHTWRCPVCDTVPDRDVNTARNLLVYGPAVLNDPPAGSPGSYACGPDETGRGAAGSQLRSGLGRNEQV